MFGEKITFRQMKLKWTMRCLKPTFVYDPYPSKFTIFIHHIISIYLLKRYTLKLSQISFLKLVMYIQII